MSPLSTGRDVCLSWSVPSAFHFSFPHYFSGHYLHFQEKKKNLKFGDYGIIWGNHKSGSCIYLQDHTVYWANRSKVLNKWAEQTNSNKLPTQQKRPLLVFFVLCSMINCSKARGTNGKFIQPQNLTQNKLMPSSFIQLVHITLFYFPPKRCVLIVICVGTSLNIQQWLFIKMQKS